MSVRRLGPSEPDVILSPQPDPEVSFKSKSRSESIRKQEAWKADIKEKTTPVRGRNTAPKATPEWRREESGLPRSGPAVLGEENPIPTPLEVSEAGKVEHKSMREISKERGVDFNPNTFDSPDGAMPSMAPKDVFETLPRGGPVLLGEVNENGRRTFNTKTTAEGALPAFGVISAIGSAAVGASHALGGIKNALKDVPVLGRAADVTKDIFDFTVNPAFGGILTAPAYIGYRLGREALDAAGIKEKSKVDLTMDPVGLAEQVGNAFGKSEPPKEDFVDDRVRKNKRVDSLMTYGPTFDSTSPTELTERPKRVKKF